MIDTIGYIAGFLAMISFFPQIIKTLGNKVVGTLQVQDLRTVGLQWGVAAAMSLQRVR